MTFTSYAQNFEDVILWRALKNIKNGLYIDIGAQDPIIDSVSKGFYDNGWRGINVEPTTQYSQLLREHRSDEIVLQVAISNQCQDLLFYEFPDSGLSTACEKMAQEHIANGFKCKQSQVSTLSVDNLLEMVSGEIHWLKVDVEGLEAAVFSSWNNDNIKPWIILVESTLPMTQELSSQAWEHVLLNKGYEFVYFDGLNNFYISEEHPELKCKFKTPPNIFDNFTFNGTSTSLFCSTLNAKILDLEFSLDNKKKEIESIKGSMSWLITKPLRWMMSKISN